MNEQRQNLQDVFLNTLRKEHTPVSIFLVNGIKLVGRIESFDQYMVLLKGHDQAVQAIFKHAISTISPARAQMGGHGDRPERPERPHSERGYSSDREHSGPRGPRGPRPPREYDTE